jgi:hypothetical protein
VQSRSSEFYRKGINDLPIRWQQCIDNNGNYIDEFNLLKIKKLSVLIFSTNRQFHTLTPIISHIAPLIKERRNAK